MDALVPDRNEYDRLAAARPFRVHMGVQVWLKYAIDLDLAGLRSWQVRDFPFLIFYTVHAEYLDVWRVLHAQRDIPASLQDERQSNTQMGIQEAIAAYNDFAEASGLASDGIRTF